VVVGLRLDLGLVLGLEME